MNAKQLFLVFSMVMFAVVIADQDKKTYSAEDIDRLLSCSGFTYSDGKNPFYGCRTNPSSHCNLVMEHLAKALEHDERRSKIKNLEDQMKELSSEQLQRPVKRRLDEAREKHPHGQKNYWAILSEQEQNALIQAAADIAEKNYYTMSYVINELKEALNQ